jgi:sortase A
LRRGDRSLAAAVAILAKAHVGQALLEVSWKRAQARGDAPPPWPWADTRPSRRCSRRASRRSARAGRARTAARSRGAGRRRRNGKPGEHGNAIVTAHRDTHFRFLADVTVGDPLIVERIDGVRVAYRIVATRIADASSLAIRARSTCRR